MVPADRSFDAIVVAAESTMTCGGWWNRPIRWPSSMTALCAHVATMPASAPRTMLDVATRMRLGLLVLGVVRQFWRAGTPCVQNVLLRPWLPFASGRWWPRLAWRWWPPASSAVAWSRSGAWREKQRTGRACAVFGRCALPCESPGRQPRSPQRRPCEPLSRLSERPSTQSTRRGASGDAALWR